MTRQWAPGDVALYEYLSSGRLIALRIKGGNSRRGRPCPVDEHGDADHWHLSNGGWTLGTGESIHRPLVVIDPEDDDQVARLADARLSIWNGPEAHTHVSAMQAALREFAEAVLPTEPTDPKAWVTDRRENVWRLLADGDWVCTSGPDIGEYLVWAKLAAERGPLEVEVTP